MCSFISQWLNNLVSWNWWLSVHQSWKPSIDCIQDIAFFCGIFGIIKFIINYNFNKKTSEIQINLEKRKELGQFLTDYVYEKYKNNKKDIAVRFIYWKNYPWKLDDDGYKEHLYYDTNNGVTLPGGFISKTGINFVQHIWFFSKSVYVNKEGLYFIDDKGKQFKRFKEVEGKNIFVFELPFRNIINFDFEDKLEYEAVFYTRYKYDNLNLYNDDVYLRNFDNDKYINIKLRKRDNINRPNSFKHLCLALYYLFCKKK